MKILFISHIVPSLKHIEAANIVQYELLYELSKRNFNISFLFLKNVNNTLSNIAKLNELEFDTVKTFDYSFPKNNRNIVQKIFFPKKEDYFPDCQEQNKLGKILEDFSPDYLLTIWDEKATNLMCSSSIKKICYYGNPPPKNFSEILKAKLLKKDNLQKIFLFLKNIFHKIQFNKFHYQIIKKVDFFFNVSKLDSKFYENKRIKCNYINNVYKISCSLKKIKKIKSEVSSQKKIKIIGNVGNINGTANTLGIKYLINFVFPELKKHNLEFEIHIFGGGKITSYIKEFSKVNPEFIVRGFVKNIDEEICNSSIFLCCNNATNYNVGHTRYLHSFSLGTCVVAHKNLSLVMPEMCNNINCCLGESPKEIADIIYNLSLNKLKIEEIGLNGYNSLKKDFSSKKAVDQIIKTLGI